jgi:hypothetical protein
MKRLQLTITILIILLGIVHITFAFPIDELTEGTLWFIGSGVALVLSGLINWIASEGGVSKRTKWITLLCNILMCGLFILAIPVVQGPQVYMGIGLFLAASTLSMLRLT